MTHSDLELALPRLMLPSNFEGNQTSSLRGYVEIFDALSGIQGWALDLSDLTSVISIDLCLGEYVITSTSTGAPRDDLSALLTAEIAAGFRFDATAMRLIANQAKVHPDDQIEVRLGGTLLQFSSDMPLPTAGSVAKAIARINEKDSVRRLGLNDLLLELTDKASELLMQPLRRIPENAQGVIEAITVSPAGYVWFLGWMSKGYLPEFSGIVADREKYPCGVALLCYERSDLQRDACGVVGVIASDWHPNTLSQEFALFFGIAARAYFRVHQPLRVMSVSDFISQFDNIRLQFREDRRGLSLAKMLNELEHWSHRDMSAQGFVAYASIDRLLLVPGFGCLAEGWILSPVKRVSYLQLRVEDKVLRCALDTLYYKARPDLLASHPGQDVLAQTAGFIACFLGDVTGEDVSEPTLKIVFRDGSTLNQPIALNVVSQLGYSVKVDAVRLFYPEVEFETFFPDLAAKLLPTGLGVSVLAHAVACIAEVSIFILPQDRCDLILLFDNITQRAHSGKLDFGIVLVGSSSTSRADTLRLFKELTEAAPGKASLFFSDDISQPLDFIAPILEATMAERFFFAGPSIFLFESGWVALSQALKRHNSLELFDVVPDRRHFSEHAGLPPSLCFAWSANPAAIWRASALRLFGGFGRDDLLDCEQNIIRHRGAGRITRRREVTPLEEAVNALAVNSFQR